VVCKSIQIVTNKYYFAMGHLFCILFLCEEHCKRNKKEKLEFVGHIWKKQESMVKIVLQENLKTTPLGSLG